MYSRNKTHQGEISSYRTSVRHTSGLQLDAQSCLTTDQRPITNHQKELHLPNITTKYFLMRSIYILIILWITSFAALAQQHAGAENDSIQCAGSWKQGVFGNNVGNNSMNVADIDGDGINEIVAHASASSSYWFVMEYSSASNGYVQSWISGSYSQITCIKVLDLDSNGDKEIVVGLDNGMIEIWDGVNLSMVTSFLLPIISGDYGEPEGMLVADADNDGVKELVINTHSHIYLYNANTLNYENSLEYGGYYIACGNVDSDPNNEIVVSKGQVLRLNGTNVTVLWQFANSTYGFEWTGLIDSDNDGKQEVFYDISHYLKVYDADLQQLKYELACEATAASFTITDTDNNGTAELIYGDFQPGHIHCINPSDGSDLWSYYVGFNNVTSTTVADSDHDGLKELIWTAGDAMQVCSIGTFQEEWNSPTIDGPFNVRVGDVDNDGEKEVLTFSQSSQNDYSSGILTIWDESSREIEWQSNEFTFDFSLRDVLDFEIADIDNDGITEIIVASGTYNVWIWVMNGQTHEIESSHDYTNISNFKAIEITDIDDNGSLDYICSSGSAVYVINPADFSIRWSKNVVYYGDFMLIGNTDTDPAKEIVVYGWGQIGIVDAITQQVIQINEPYASVALCDVDNDGDQEVLAGSLSGKIALLDGATLQFIKWLPFNFGNSYVSGLVADDFENDGVPDLLISYGDRLYFSDLTGFINTSSKVGLTETGTKHPINVIDDYDGDGKKEVFASSDCQVVEYRFDCYKCRNFNGILTGEDISCVSDNDGSVNLEIFGGTPPYTFLWNNGSTMQNINNLSPALYTVIATDALGCKAHRETVLIKSVLEVSTSSTVRGCDNVHYGQAAVEITEGHAPYSYTWSGINDTTSMITGLEAGSYPVHINDRKQCTADKTINVPADTIKVDLEVTNINCHTDGIIIATATGIEPLSFNWSHGSTDQYLFNIPEGSYTLTVRDAYSCTGTATGVIKDAGPLTATVTTTDDNPTTPAGEGSITILATGGERPYFYYINNFLSDSIKSGLRANTYSIYIYDYYNCSYSLPATVEYSTGKPETGIANDFLLYPNPATDEFYIELKTTDPATRKVNAEIYSSHNILISKYPITETRTKIPVHDLKKGIYFLKLTIEDAATVVKVVVI